MKKIVVFVILIMVGLAVAGCSKSHMTPETPRLEDSIIQMPAADKYIYGDSHRTKILYNLAALRATVLGYEKELTALRKEVEELKSRTLNIEHTPLNDKNKPYTSLYCNEAVGQGCGFNYWKCSKHTPATDPNDQ